MLSRDDTGFIVRCLLADAGDLGIAEDRLHERVAMVRDELTTYATTAMLLQAFRERQVAVVVRDGEVRFGVPPWLGQVIR
ncbi:MAG TPA: hypothetical protein VGD67_13840 [Pseudonocardiaceae bacterium]